MLKLALVIVFCAFAPHLIKRTHEVDSEGNATLRLWGACAFSAAVGSFFLWRGFEVLHDTSYPDDAAALFGLSAFCFLGSGYFLFSKITLFNNRIEQKILPLWTTVYSLGEMTSIDESGGHTTVLRFSGGRKLAVFSLHSGRPFFLKQLRALTNHSTGPAQKAAPAG
jgi:hypothetical protein